MTTPTASPVRSDGPAADAGPHGPAAALWRLALLLLGTHLHVMVLASHPGLREAVGFAGWGPGGVLLMAPAGYLLALVLEAGLIAGPGAHGAALCSLVVAFGPAPLYMQLFPVGWGPAAAGLAFCLLQGELLLRRRHAASGEPERPGTPGWLTADDRQREQTDMVLVSCFACLVAVLLDSGYHMLRSPVALVAAWGLAGLSVAMSMANDIGRHQSLSVWTFVEYALLVVAGVCLTTPGARGWVLPVVGLRQAMLALRLWLTDRGGRQLWQYLNERPFQLLVGSFGLVIATGTLLLSLPIAARSRVPVAAIDALFTATSATCVTGLASVDTGTVFSPFGQITILALIQVGGLGVMTISTFFALLLGRNLGLREEFAMKRLMGEEGTHQARRLLIAILLTTVTIEGAGAGLLAWSFYGLGYTWTRSLQLGVFHSVSAFCNAGFSPFADNLVTVSRQPLIPLTISVLIILGGLGFAVVVSLLDGLRGRRALPLHTKLTLTVTAALLVGGAVLLWSLDRDHGFRHMSGGQAALHAWFQSVTARTAGFNTVDLTTLAPASHLLLIALMFVGAAPGSTGGGVKVTTLAVLLLAMRSVMQGRVHVVVAGRRLSPWSVLTAAALTCVAVMAIGTGAGVLMVTDGAQSFTALLFEAVSAFGTVGLSLNLTPLLSAVGKLCVVALMFLGRIGPLAMLLAMQPRERPIVEYPVDDVPLG